MNLLEFARVAIKNKLFAAQITTGTNVQYITSDYILLGNFIVWMVDIKYVLPDDTLGFHMTMPAEVNGFINYKPLIGVVSGKITDIQGSYDFTASKLIEPKLVKFNVGKSTNFGALKAGAIRIQGIMIYSTGKALTIEQKPKPIL